MSNKKMFFSQNITPVASNSISVIPDSMLFGPLASSRNATVTIVPSDVNPVIRENALWISTSYSGTTVTVTVPALKAGSPPRYSTVTLTHPLDAGIFCEIAVSQVSEI